MSKDKASLEDAVAGVRDDYTLMIGGFGGCGAPVELMHALIDRFFATGSPSTAPTMSASGKWQRYPSSPK